MNRSKEIQKICLVAIGLRVAIVLITHFGIDQLLSRYFQWYYTDIDYFIYSDAGEHLRLGDSPYERITYRYPPLLAYLMKYNSYCGFILGKLLFSVIDGLIVYEIAEIQSFLSIAPETSRRWCWLWAINPLTVYLCTRGSCDSLPAYGILLTIRLLFTAKESFSSPSPTNTNNNSNKSSSSWWVLIGCLIGFNCWFRLYPVLYVPAFLIYCLSPPHTSHQQSLTFLTAIAIIWITLTLLSYWYYDLPYLQESLLYHLSRRDHRHNFSSYFYPIYLEKSLMMMMTTTSNSEHSMSSTSHPYPLYPLLEKGITILLLVVLASVFLLSYLWSRQSSPDSRIALIYCLLLVTVIFVVFNKVITAQYFLWFLIFLPFLSTPGTSEWNQSDSVSLIKYLGGNAVLLAVALLSAAKIELAGQPFFYQTWICDLLFLVGNVITIHRLLWMMRQQLKKESIGVEKLE